MSDMQEMQEEEREALSSIYEGDTDFKQVNPTTYQYKYGVENEPKSFLLELSWGDEYPNVAPTINLDMFYNRNIIAAVKAAITDCLHEESEQWLGCGMTYTLFECLKERLDQLLADQPEHGQAAQTADVVRVSGTAADDAAAAGKGPKKEQLTKSQKRRQWEQSDHSGNKPRGYNWVDIVKHLSQTGGKEEGGAVPTNYEG